MKFINLFILSYIFWKEIQGIPPTKNYLDGLIKYLKKESKVHQVVFVLDDYKNYTDPIMNSVITAVNSHFSSFIVTYDRGINFEEFDKVINFPGRITLFVIQWIDDSTAFKLQDFILELIDGFLNPRYLVVNSNNSTHSGIIDFLETYYLRRQLFGIIFLTLDNELKITLTPNFEKLPVLSKTHYHFKNNYSSQLISSESEWFPDKLMNLNEETFSFNLNFPTDICIIKEEKEILEVMLRLMKSRMKSTSEDEIYKSVTFGNLELYFGFSYGISSPDNDYEIININSVKAVIPKALKLSKDIEASLEFWYIILKTIGTIVVIRLTGYLLKFSISKIIMRISDTQESENWSKRVVFVPLMIACIVYTGYIYLVFFNQTLINFHPAVEISSLAELTKSHLTPMMKNDVYNALLDSSISDVQQFIKKYLILKGHDEEYCLKYLADYQNITCIIANAEYHVNKYEAKIRESKFKILDETVIYYFSYFSIYHEKCLNYYAKLFKRVKEFGLLEDFNRPFLHPRNSNTSPRLITKEELLPILITVLIIGYSLSTIVFILGILKKRLRITKIVHTSKASLNKRDYR